MPKLKSKVCGLGLGPLYNPPPPPPPPPPLMIQGLSGWDFFFYFQCHAQRNWKSCCLSNLVISGTIKTFPASWREESLFFLILWALFRTVVRSSIEEKITFIGLCLIPKDTLVSLLVLESALVSPSTLAASLPTAPSDSETVVSLAEATSRYVSEVDWAESTWLEVFNLVTFSTTILGHSMSSKMD